MQSRRAALVGLSAFWLTGCGDSLRPKVTSNKDQAYSIKLERVLVAMDLKATTLLRGTPIVPSEIEKAMTRRWASLGVSLQSVDLETSKDKTNALADAVMRFQPKQIMELDVDNIKFLMGLVTDVSIEGSVLDAATQKRIWRSSIDLKGRFSAKIYKIPPDKAADEIVDALTAKLTADGLL